MIVDAQRPALSWQRGLPAASALPIPPGEGRWAVADPLRAEHAAERRGDRQAALGGGLARFFLGGAALVFPGTHVLGPLGPAGQLQPGRFRPEAAFPDMVQ